MRLGFAFILGFLLVADLLVWWASVRWLGRYSKSKQALWAAHAFFGIQTGYAMCIAAMAMLGSLHTGHLMGWIPLWVQALIYVWHMVFLPLSLLMWIVVGAIWTGVRLVRLIIAASRSPAGEKPVEETGLTRRNLLLASVVAVPPLLAAGATGYALTEAWSFRLTRRQLALHNLPSGLEGLRIAQVSDLHVGRWTTQKFLDRVVQETNSLNADLVLFTGDLLDVSVEDLDQAIDTARRFCGRLGMYMIEGNHDLMDDPARFRSSIIRAGLNFLRGTSAIVEHNRTLLEVMGIPWSRSDAVMREDVGDVVARRDPTAYPILMAHHPHAFDAAAEAGLPLTLSGHTHGGQLALNRDINAGNVLFRYVSGLYQQGNSRLLVSNGTGNWFPLRIGAPAEIIEITLTRA